MTIGTSSWKGLGMGLQGEYELTQLTAGTDILTITGATSMAGDFLVMRDADGTERNSFYCDGRIFNTVAHDAAMNTRTGVTYMEGVHLGTTITTTTGGSDALSCVLTHSSGTCNGQMYAAEFWFEGSASASVGGGRVASIHCIMNLSTSYGTVLAATSFINFSEPTKRVPNLFTLPYTTVDASSGCFKKSDGDVAVTHLLRINVNNDTYYICVSDSSAT